MPHDALVTIGGKEWQLVYADVPGKFDGDCDHPEKPNPIIRIHRSLRNGRAPRKLLRTLIHEVLHAGAWNLDDEAVTQLAKDIEAVLWKQGFRQEV